MGYLSDTFDIWLLATVSLITTCLVTFLVWGLWAYSLLGILAYGTVYGITAGSWSSMWYGFITPIASRWRYTTSVCNVSLIYSSLIEDDPSLSTTLFSFLLMSRGIGNILSTPISTALQRTHSDAAHLHPVQPKSGFAVAEGRYDAMICYAGTCFAGAAVVAIIGWSVDRRSHSHATSARR